MPKHEKPAEPDIRECRFCHVAIQEFDYGTGKEWLHIKSNPEVAPGQPYKICETFTVATPPETVGEWASKLLLHQPKEKE